MKFLLLKELVCLATYLRIVWLVVFTLYYADSFKVSKMPFCVWNGLNNQIIWYETSQSIAILYTKQRCNCNNQSYQHFPFVCFMYEMKGDIF